MRRGSLALIAAAAGALAGVQDARAWEPATTHAGLTEQAALSGVLHRRLHSDFGIDLGLFAPLTVPPADAPSLFAALRELNPTHGYAPDKRGRQTALAWLAAGAVVADMPVAAARNHFFDPDGGGGLRVADDGGLLARLFRRDASELAAAYVGVRRAVPAVQWITTADNPLNLAGFLGQYQRAVTARTPGERERHIAGALVAAGAILHVLQDMGSPSHVRDDFAAHLSQLSDDRRDVGSRFERVAALSYGRLGIPAPARTITRDRLRDFFTSEDKKGLADWTAASWFSAGTLPRPISVKSGLGLAKLGSALKQSLVRPQPAPDASGLDELGAHSPDGATLVNPDRVCLARYAIADGALRWSTDDQCVLQQIGAILPIVSAYSQGLLDFLFRGSLELTTEAGQLDVAVRDVAVGAGKVTLLWDDEAGVRTALGEPQNTSGGAVGQRLVEAGQVPARAHAVVALFEGVDGSGEPLIATGRVVLDR
jgi:hypothetical protein